MFVGKDKNLQLLRKQIQEIQEDSRYAQMTSLKESLIKISAKMKASKYFSTHNELKFKRHLK